MHKNLAEMKGKWVDNSHSSDYDKIHSNAHRRKRCTYEEEEHMWHMRSLKTRIENIDNPVERKKNLHDPIAHPTRLFWRIGDETAE